MAPTDRDTLLDMGFAEEAVAKALKATGGAGLGPALDWLEKFPDGNCPEESSASADASAPEQTGTSSTAPEPEAQSMVCDECGKQLRDEAAMQFHASKTGHTNFSQSVDAVKPLTEEEKKAMVELAKQKIAEKRQKRSVEEAEEARKREILRRKAGQQASEMRESLTDLQRRQAIEQKKKDAELDKQAKERALARIRESRLERERERQAALGNTAQAQPASASPSPASTATSSAPAAPKVHTDAVLQFRPPQGAPQQKSFPASAPLQEVLDYLAGSGLAGTSNGIGTFKLMILPSRKQFGTDNASSTLSELGLAPRSALIIVASA
ncbi:hypothetical protein GQ42DRAFT_161748 [Ramicandelaber brevisporus]|nr:hypothetical protein GQ42DRAFT_161748 [Ramicandelaber brevisporus]